MTGQLYYLSLPGTANGDFQCSITLQIRFESHYNLHQFNALADPFIPVGAYQFVNKLKDKVPVRVTVPAA